MLKKSRRQNSREKQMIFDEGKNEWSKFDDHQTGQLAQDLYNELTDIQTGKLADRFGWIGSI